MKKNFTRILSFVMAILLSVYAGYALKNDDVVIPGRLNPHHYHGPSAKFAVVFLCSFAVLLVIGAIKPYKEQVENSILNIFFKCVIGVTIAALVIASVISCSTYKEHFLPRPGYLNY